MNKFLSLPLIGATSLALTACATNSEGKRNKSYIDNEAAIANVQMGIAYLKKNDTVLAKRKFTKAIQEAPNLPASWYAMAYYNEVTGKLEQADQQYRKAIAVAPNSGEAHNNYGTFLCRHGKYRQAIAQFDQAIEEPSYMQDGAAYENAGICALAMPDKKLAYHYFQQALLNDPNLTNALLHLGELSYQYKDYTTARNSLGRYLKLHKPNADSRALQTKLTAVRGKPGITNKDNILVNQRFAQMVANSKSS